MLHTRYRRILLKLSGEALAGNRPFGIDPQAIATVVNEIKPLYDAGIQIGIVLGGGNIFRGITGTAMAINRVSGDAIGMLATVINSLMLKEYLQNAAMAAVVLNAVRLEKVAGLFSAPEAIELLEQKKIVIISGGTGNPFFTTDTAAALRCAEIGGEVLIKATKVNGVYESDPVKNPQARQLSTLTHNDALSRNLQFMDATALTLCRDNNIPILVLKMLEPGNLYKAACGETVGSLVTRGD